MFKNKNALKIISILTALCLWMYVIGEVDPETRSKVGNIEVYLTNTDALAEKGLAVNYEEPIEISATISGKVSEVNTARKNGMTAYVDVSDCKKGRNEERIVINTPDGINIENASNTVAKLEVEEISTRSVPVNIEFENNEINSDEVAWVIEQHPDVVNVTGVKSVVDDVVEVKGVLNKDVAKPDKRKWVDVKLKPLNNEGTAIKSLEISTSVAEAEVQLFSVKSVELEIEEDSEIKTLNVNIPKNVRIAGAKKDIEDIDRLKGSAVIEENGKVRINVNLPENVFLVVGKNYGKIIWN